MNRHLLILTLLTTLLAAPTDAGVNEGFAAYDKGNFTQALNEFKPLAEQGNTYAQIALGVMYEYGQGVPQDYQQAVAWYRKAAEQGDARAQKNLAVMYFNGQGVLQDYQQAGAWYRKAAEQGDIDAQFYLGAMLDKGQGVPQDYRQAVVWYRKAAEQGRAEAQLNLGNIFSFGHGVPQDNQQAIAWYRKAAEQGNSEAQFNLGLMYDKGQGVPQDYRQAVVWYRKAAEQGLAEAQTNLGVMYEYGRGVTKDNVLTYMLYNLGAAGEHEHGSKNRENISQRMTPRQIEEAQSLTRNWKVGTPLPTKSKTGQIKEDLASTEDSAPAPKKLKACNPPTGKTLRYSDKCYNGDCVRTFENGCQKRFQAPYCYDALSGNWTWKPDGC